MKLSRSLRFAICVLAILPGHTRVVPAATDRIAVSTSGTAIPRFGIVELNIEHTDASFANVWEGPDVTATFTSPIGRTYRVGAFYHSRDLWKVRFAPSETGTWRWSVQWRDSSGAQQADGTFECVPSADPGFVRRHPTNPYRLVFEDSSLYSAIGIGDCITDADRSGSPLNDWGFDGGFRAPGDHTGSRTGLDTYLSAYGGAGFNLFRWSVDNCAFRLWERIDPAGNAYLENEGRFGDILAASLRRYGFRIYLVIFNQAPFPTETSDQAKMNALKRYVQYVVDRYGAYVDFWELMNEFPSSHTALNPDWYGIVADYIRSIDPYGRLISTSWERPDLGVIDINSPHWYEKENELESDIAAARRIRSAKTYAKPIIFGEQGNLVQNWDERSALRMRIRSWTAFFEEAALIFWNSSFAKDFQSEGAANIYLGPEERGYIRVLQDFAARADAGVRPYPLSPSSSGIRAYGLRSSRMILGYFHHFTSHSDAINSNLSLELSGSAFATWIDPATGAILRSDTLPRGRHTVPMPPFTVDLGLRIEFAAEEDLAYFSQFASGGDFVSSLILTNPSRTRTAGGTVRFSNDDGEPLFLSINGESPADRVPFSISPLGTVTLTTGGKGPATSGSAQVRATVAVGGVIKFFHPALGTAGVGRSAPMKALMMPVVRSSAQARNTGVAISNPQDRPMEVTLSLRELNGQQVSGGLASRTLAPNGHLARLLEELFPQAALETFRGTLTIAAVTPGGEITATAIQIGSSVGEFTTLPVVAVDPAPTERELFFAQFGAGAGFSSSVFLTNPSDRALTGQLSFHGDDGADLPLSLPGKTTAKIDFEIQPAGGVVVITDAAGPLSVGSARVSSSGVIGGVLGFALPGLGSAGVGASVPTSEFLLPASRDAASGFRTGLAVVSASLPVLLGLTLNDRNGAPVPRGQTLLLLPARGHIARFIDELFPAADTRQFEGTLTVTAAGRYVAATAIELGPNPGNFTALPVTPLVD